MSLHPVTDGTSSDAERLLRSLGIDKAVVCNIATNAKQEEKVNGYAISLLNNDFFYPLGSVHPDSENIESELDRLLLSGIRGIKLHPDYVGIELSDRRFDRIFSLLSERDMFTVVHTGYDPISPDKVHATPEMLRAVCDEVVLDNGILDRLPEGTAPEAPGMKYRHYAPRARVHLLRAKNENDGSFDEKAVEFFREKLKADPSVGILCYDEYLPFLQGENVYSYGKKQDDLAHSHLLFDCLRRFDETEATAIYAVVGKAEGIGLALYNRMLKASAYTVIYI
jgi:hypothetical protein